MRPKATALYAVCASILVFALLPLAAQDAPRARHFSFGFGGGAWLGVSVQDVTDELIESENLKVKEGAFVSEVTKESPADTAGLRGGDVITEFNNRKIYDADGLVTAVRKTKSGEKVSIVADRNGRKLEMTTTLHERHRRTAMRIPTPPTPPVPHEGYVRMREMSGGGRVGLRLTNLTPQLGEFFNVPEGKGALVEEVVKESSAEKAGFKAGDVIVAVDNKETESVREVRDALRGYDKDEKATVTVVRNRARTNLTIEFEEKPFSWYQGDFEDLNLEFDMDIFSEGDRERLREELKDLKPKLDDLKIELDGLHEHFRNFKFEFPEKMIREIRIHRESVNI
jgi:C-terminal processing protease CtpA/Prc